MELSHIVLMLIFYNNAYQSLGRLQDMWGRLNGCLYPGIEG
jgi:hypothetical protein